MMKSDQPTFNDMIDEAKSKSSRNVSVCPKQNKVDICSHVLGTKVTNSPTSLN